MPFISVYSTDRSYGGPEEGGWWYNHNEYLGESIEVPEWDQDNKEVLDKIERARELLKSRHAPDPTYKNGNFAVDDNFMINGVPADEVPLSSGEAFGPEEINTFYEDVRGEHQTKEKPYYE